MGTNSSPQVVPRSVLKGNTALFGGVSQYNQHNEVANGGRKRRGCGDDGIELLILLGKESWSRRVEFG